ncbi:unnamed protein product, partial [Rhizoctonia solani]
MSSSGRYKPYKTPLVHHSISRSKYITTTRRPAASSEPDRPYRPSMLVAAPRRITKAKLAEISEHDRAREEAIMKDKLTQAQRAELNALRSQVAGGSNVHEEILYNTPENDFVDPENDGNESGDEWVDDNQETAVMGELGLRSTGNT